MAFREIWNGPSFLNRSDVVRRMAERDNAGKRNEKVKKTKKTTKNTTAKIGTPIYGTEHI